MFLFSFEASDAEESAKQTSIDVTKLLMLFDTYSGTLINNKDKNIKLF